MEAKKYTHDEWLTEGKELFGEHGRDWQFECPMCGNVQTPKDFVAIGHSEEDASHNAPQYCIGNFSDHDCDWKSFGLFRGPSFVVFDDGKEVPVFAFNQAIEAPETATETEKANEKDNQIQASQDRESQADR